MTVINNMGDMGCNQRHVMTNPFEKERKAPAAFGDMVESSLPGPDFTMWTVQAQNLRSQPPTSEMPQLPHVKPMRNPPLPMQFAWKGRWEALGNKAASKLLTDRDKHHMEGAWIGARAKGTSFLQGRLNFRQTTDPPV